DGRGVAVAVAGRLADRWPPGTVLAPPGREVKEESDSVLQAGGDTFRVVTIPLLLDEGVSIGSLNLATSLDRRYAEQLDRISRTRSAILNDGAVVATTLSSPAARELETALAQGNATQGVATLDGESHAYLQLASAGTASFYAVSSIDDASRIAIRRA